MQILLTLAYDGTEYAGWQRQQNAIAVQQRLEEALSALYCQSITTKAPSRTDAGVHALCQRAAFFVDETRIPIGKLPQVLNGYLPRDISVSAAEVVPDSFNPRFDAMYKTYAYSIYNAPTPNPLYSRYSAHEPRSMNVEAMKNAASMLIGQHDFAAFQSTGSSAKNTVREIYALDIITDKPPGMVTMIVTGNGFLYNMVRIIAGTMMYVGIGKLRAHSIPRIILSCDRARAGKTMPPQGLTLLEVGYTKYRQLE